MAIIRAKPIRAKKEIAPNPHHDLCLLAEKFLKGQKFGVVFRDGFKAVTNSGEQVDALGFRSGFSCLIEIKVSRSDFLQDKKKTFRVNPVLGVGQWRFYLCPAGLINITDLPDGWGLLWLENGKIKKIHGWPSNTRWCDAPFAQRYNYRAEAEIMYSALRRIEIQGQLGLIYDGLYGRCELCKRQLNERHEIHPEHGKICLKSCG